MQESLLVLSGVIIGTIFTCAGCALGAYLVKLTYMEVTNPLPLLVKIDGDKEDNTTTSQAEGYDWDEYESYLKPPMD